MDLRDLELLVAVVDAGSISRGGEQCGLSLSGASGRLAALERRHGLQLVERQRRGVVPTVAGARLAAQARHLLAQVERLETSFAATAGGLRHELRLAVNSAAADALPELLAVALNRMPEVSVEQTELSTRASLDRLRDGRVDLAVVSVLEPVRGFQVWDLWDDPLVVVGPPRPAAGQVQDQPAGLTLAQVMAEPVVGLTPQVPMQRLVDGRSRRAGLHPAYRIRLPNLAAVIAVATTGVGRAIVPRAAARRLGVPEHAQQPLLEDWAPRRAVVVSPADRPMAEHTREFLELLLEHRRDIADPRHSD